MGNRLIAEYDRVGSRYLYYTQDQINSTRIVTDDTGAVVYSEAYNPYGGVQHTWVNSFDPTPKLSGKERDSESELDYFGARYYDKSQYRFISVDPKLVFQVAQVDPQRWGLYPYCANNPISMIDPSGKWGSLVYGTWTYRLGLKAGLPANVALQIAQADKDVDWNFGTSCISPSESVRKTWHFASTETYGEALKICETTLNAKEFGKYLHVIQDYFAHSAISLMGGSSHTGAEYAGIDDPYSGYHDWPKTMAMAELSLDLMREFKERINAMVAAIAESIVASIRGIFL